MSGRISGGQQPVSGAAIQMYAVSAADGGASTPLLNSPVTTDVHGAFTITGDFTCPSASSLVYLVAVGGNPGLAPATNNPAISLMSALGACGSLTPSTFVVVNEVSTVVSVWGLAPFMTGYASIGADAANAPRLTAAFSEISQQVNLLGGLQAAGIATNSGLQIDSLADVLSGCVNSAGGAAGDGTVCGTLFRDVTPPGGVAPTETVGAALVIATYPTLNTDAVFKLAPPLGPFQPTLNAAPAFWANSFASPGGRLSVPVGAIAEYDFLEGSGMVLADGSGSGNDGTLGVGSKAPTWTATGLQFTGEQNVSLPPALNASQTFFFALYVDPLLGSGTLYDQDPVLLSNSKGAAGFSLLYDAFSGQRLVPYAYAPTAVVNGVPTTAAAGVLSGFHVFGVVLGSGSSGDGLDHLYVDGQEVTYLRQGSSGTVQNSGNFYLGSSGVSPLLSSGFNGTLFRMVSYPNVVSASAVQAITSNIVADLVQRGVPTAPVPSPSAPTPVIQAIGDSITLGSGASEAWPNLLSFPSAAAYAINDLGIYAITLEAISGSEPNRVALHCPTDAGPAIAIVFAGTNDLIQPENSAQTVFGFLTSEIQTLKTAGCRVFAGTMISRHGEDGTGTTLDEKKDAYDALILSQAISLGAEGVVDFAANPLLGADGASSDAYFQGDGVHPTDAGQALLAAAASNTLAYYLGSTEANPTRVTSADYGMAAGDRYVTRASSTAGTLTLPDCTGPSGAVYHVTNTGAGAATIVSGSGSQPIGGFPGGVPVMPAMMVAVMDVANAKNVSGCTWAVTP